MRRTAAKVKRLRHNFFNDVKRKAGKMNVASGHAAKLAGGHQVRADAQRMGV
ncbi:MAG: hypothetical protein GY774_11180 [Planctomycetes bacterium]|nr:hypothetical protein [Planctomycetota bacterium]|tara:strand:- start:129 stop:284 length:156 start_codon:yes stop_codon:yes gene_type:complete